MIEQMELLKELLIETQRLAFPSRCKDKMRRILFAEEKEVLTRRMQEILKESGVSPDYEECWSKAVHTVTKEYKGLADRLQLNAFYYQQVMSCYVENCMDTVEAALVEEPEMARQSI